MKRPLGPLTSCRHQPACPGCPRYGQGSVAPAALERLAGLAREAGAPFEALEGVGFGYRHRVRLSVRGSPGRPRLGIFEAGSHRLVHIPDCPLHHPAIEEVSFELIEQAARLGVAPYDEARHAGLLRTVQLVVERPTGRVQVVLVLCTSPDAPEVERSPALHLAMELSAHPKVHSVWLNFQPLRTNTLLGPHFEHLIGPTAVEDRSGGVRVFYPPGAFGQANPAEHDRVIAQIHAAVGSEPVLEAYAGVGAIGLGLAARGNRLTFNEAAPASLEGLALGIGALKDPDARIVPGPAGNLAEGWSELDPETTVIVDPPRKGLDPELLDVLATKPPRRLAYLSCDLDSFERDAAVLRAGLRLTRLDAYPYFPFTDHVETLALLERR